MQRDDLRKRKTFLFTTVNLTKECVGGLTGERTLYILKPKFLKLLKEAVNPEERPDLMTQMGFDGEATFKYATEVDTAGAYARDDSTPYYASTRPTMPSLYAT